MSDFHRNLIDTKNNNGIFQDLTYKNRRDKKTVKEKFKNNWQSGLTVGLINLPLYIALGIAAKAPPNAAILSAIISGLLGGWLGGSNYNVLGPSPVIASFLSYGVLKSGFAILPYYAITIGILTYISTFYKLERYIDLFPYIVNKGFVFGVSLTAFTNQMNFAFGITVDLSKRDLDSEFTIVHMLIETFSYRHTWNYYSLLVYLFFLLCLLYLTIYHSKIPWMIVFAFLGILLGYLQIKVELLESRTNGFDFNIFNFNYLKLISPFILLDPRLWVESIPIAFVTIIETLISSKIADTMTNTKFHKYREMRGLAVSNIFCGILGAFPVAGSISRTYLNIRSGASHKYSAIVNSITIFFLGYVFISFFSKIPLAVIGAMVSTVAIRLNDYNELKYLYINERQNFTIIILIGLICIVKNCVYGIILGLLLYLLNFCKILTNSWSEILIRYDDRLQVKESEDLPIHDEDYVLYRIIGMLNYMNVNDHLEKLKTLAEKDITNIILSLKYINYIDNEALNALKFMIGKFRKEINHNQYHKTLFITGLGNKYLNFKEDDDWINSMKKLDIIFHE